MRTQYTRVNGAKVAYQVLGEGPVDLLFVPGVVSHVEMQWADAAYARFLRKLASFSRLIVFDPRGAGASDHICGDPSLQDVVDDVGAVLDAAGSKRAAILGFSALGGNAAVVFASTHPERCRALVLCAMLAKGAPYPDDPELPAREIEEMFSKAAPVVERWGEGRAIELFAPSLAQSRYHRRSFGLFERAAIRKERLRALLAMFELVDVRHVLAAIALPTLVMHRDGDWVPISHGRYLAAHIEGARFVELQGADHIPYAGDSNAILRAVETFMGELTGRSPGERRRHAVLLFTDIVGSTERIGEIGDERWRDILEAHDELSRAEIERHGGHVVKSTGDGFLASFTSAPAAIVCAWAIREQVHRVGLDIRAGVHSGTCELIDGEPGGLAVHAANRVMSAAAPGEILVSEQARALTVGSPIELERRGTFEVKGLPGGWNLYALADDPPELLEVEARPPAASPAAELGLPDRLQVAIARAAPWLARGMERLAERRGSARP